MGAQGLIKGAEGLMKEVGEKLKEAEVTGYEGKVYTYSRGGPAGVIPFKEAAEKAWVATYQAVDALSEALLGRAPKSHYDRRLALREIEERYPRLVADLNLYDRYAARTGYLRADYLYMTSKDLELLKDEVERATKFIEDIKRALSESGASP